MRGPTLYPIPWSDARSPDYDIYFPYPSDIPRWIREVPRSRSLVRIIETPQNWSWIWEQAFGCQTFML